MAEREVKNIYEEIPVSELLYTAMKKKDAGLRLSQATAAYVDEKFELTYSFESEETYDVTNVRIILPELTTEVPSISDIYPYASFYENEMHELFDVNICLIGLDYHDRLYRIKKEAPFLPEAAKEKIKEEKKEEALAAENGGAEAAEDTDAADTKTQEGGQA